MGDRLVSVHRVQARARDTGIEAEGPLAYLWTFRGGRVIEFVVREPNEALEALDLSEWARLSARESGSRVSKRHFVRSHREA